MFTEMHHQQSTFGSSKHETFCYWPLTRSRLFLRKETLAIGKEHSSGPDKLQSDLEKVRGTPPRSKSGPNILERFHCLSRHPPLHEHPPGSSTDLLMAVISLQVGCITSDCVCGGVHISGRAYTWLAEGPQLKP